MTDYIGRYAPSPTGPLHMGSLIAAVASYCDARAHNGKWLLRIEDIDETRCRREHHHDIIATLAQFGFRWDGEIVTQSTRKARYAAALNTLHAHTYACICSRKEIADSAMGQIGIDGHIYQGTCRHALHEKMPHAIRLVTTNDAITFQDRLQSIQTQHLATDVGDFVLQRRDQLFAYQLAVVVDDHDSGVTDVVRGADLLDSTPRQIYLQRLLGYATPRYLHIPVATNQDGEKLSKQTLAPAISAANTVSTLQLALRFLGQPQSIGANRDNPAAVLDAAIANWHAEAIPARKSITLVDDYPRASAGLSSV
jgi:glutamyl-Q tRNA(Asp) synthetase